jgi:hypothetical protein
VAGAWPIIAAYAAVVLSVEVFSDLDNERDDHTSASSKSASSADSSPRFDHTQTFLGLEA